MDCDNSSSGVPSPTRRPSEMINARVQTASTFRGCGWKQESSVPHSSCGSIPAPHASDSDQVHQWVHQESKQVDRE